MPGIGPAHPLEAAPIAYATGATYYAAPTGNDGNSCLSSGAPCATTGGALAKATPGDIVSAAAGTYTETTEIESGTRLMRCVVRACERIARARRYHL